MLTKYLKSWKKKSEMKLRDVEVWRILKVYRKLEKIYREVDVKEKFHHRKNKRIKETIYTGKKKQKHFVQLNLRNRKRNIN